jgi:hypothetical protein
VVDEERVTRLASDAGRDVIIAAAEQVHVAEDELRAAVKADIAAALRGGREQIRPRQSPGDMTITVRGHTGQYEIQSTERSWPIEWLGDDRPPAARIVGRSMAVGTAVRRLPRRGGPRSPVGTGPLRVECGRFGGVSARLASPRRHRCRRCP